MDSVEESTQPRYSYQWLTDQWYQGWLQLFQSYLEQYCQPPPAHPSPWWDRELNDKLQWDSISRNPNLRIDTLRTYRNYPWNWYSVTAKIQLTPSQYQQNPEIPWDTDSLMMNPCFDSSWYQLFPKKQWDCQSYSKNPQLQVATVLANRDLPWNWDYVGLNQTVTPAIWRRHHLPLTWWGIGKNPNMEWDVLTRNPYKWYDLSSHPQLTWERVKNLEDQLRNQGQEPHWNYTQLGANPNISWKIIQDNPERPWGGTGWSQNLTWEIIQNNPEFPWDWAQLSQHPNLTWEIIYHHPGYPWDPEKVSANPNITWETVTQFPDYPWNWHQLVKNRMDLGKERWINQLRIQVLASLRIQRHWRRCSSDPRYHLAQRYLHRVYSS